MQQHGTNCWMHTPSQMYWTQTGAIAIHPNSRWTRQVSHWQPRFSSTKGWEDDQNYNLDKKNNRQTKLQGTRSHKRHHLAKSSIEPRNLDTWKMTSLCTPTTTTKLGARPPRAATPGVFTPYATTTTATHTFFAQRNARQIGIQGKTCKSGLQLVLTAFSCHAGKRTCSFKVASCFRSLQASERTTHQTGRGSLLFEQGFVGHGPITPVRGARRTK